MSEALAADVVVIGSGVAGALIAERLARGGVGVLILDAGPRIDRIAALATYMASADKGPNAPYPVSAHAPSPNINAFGDYYINTGPDTFRGVYLRAVGGSTWHWTGSVLRYRPSDFRMQSTFGVGLDWPLAYGDLAPWYDQAERELGVAGSEVETWGAPRGGGYPMPPIPPTYLDGVVGRAVEQLGMSLGVFPQARNSVAYDGRPACCGNASCLPLCPIGAKYDGGVHVAKAEAAGARLEVNAVVHALDVGVDGLIRAVRFRRPDGQEGSATGRIVVLAAHAIESPKILLMSQSERTPRGVANSSDAVGRHLMGQIDQGTRGLTREAIYPYRGPVLTSAIREFRDGPFRAHYSGVGTSLSNEGFRRAMGPLMYARTLVEQGVPAAQLRDKIAWRTARELILGSTAETLPDPDNRIVPDADQRDAIGIPRPRIHYRIDDYAKVALGRAVKRHEAVFGLLGSTEVQTFPFVTSSASILGTARMGDDPKRSVVSRDLRAHDHANLFLAGSMVFPTAGVLPPTLTIAALSLRAADTIARQLKG